MRVPAELEDTKYLEVDALGHLSLSHVHIFTNSAVKLTNIKQLVSSVSYLEWDWAIAKQPVENLRVFSFSNQNVHNMTFLEDLKDAFAESFLTQFFISLGSKLSNNRFRLRFFRLATDDSSSKDLEINASLEESTLILKMEKYIRPRLFDMMNFGRQKFCFLSIEFDETLIAAVHVNNENGQLVLRLLDQHYEEIRMRSSSHQNIVIYVDLAQGDDRDPRFGSNSGLHQQTPIVS